MIKIKQFFRKFFLINDTPHKVAAGAALGIFLGIIPGEGVTASIVVALLFRLNRLAAITGALATNMWTTFLVLPLAAWLGGKIFGIEYHDLINDFKATYELGWKCLLSKVVFFDVALPLAVGFIVVAGIIALIFYFVIYYLLKNHKIEFSKNIKN